MFAASDSDDAITINANNFCVNGNVATNGTIVSEGNININGVRSGNVEKEMLYIFNKIDAAYFSSNNIEVYDEDYSLEEMNINIITPLEVAGNAELTGNININSAIKALENVVLNGEVKNTNDSVIYSKYGDIIIDSSNVNLNGLVYAPFGDVVITAQNLNLNNVIIIADTITLNCPSVNANYSDNVANFVVDLSEELNIPYEEYEYLLDSDEDGLPDIIESYTGTDADTLNDGEEINFYGTNPLKKDTNGNGILDGNEKFYQTFTHIVKNEDCAVEEVIVSMEDTGNLQKNISVESVMNKDVICSDVVGLIGEPFEIESESQFDTASITFKIDQTKLGNTGIDNLLFLWYNEENYEFVEMETTHDAINSTVSITTTHFSRYMVVDKSQWYEAWAVEFNYNPAENNNHALPLNIILF